ncbi:ankyrin repeat domain-containing protein [Candidatus Berkiella aquae]|uniref:Ankyrin repeat domain-containing protein n=1 Tax=Candidatus Berkiella aquae TaxID=295108 RepID=A0A0Q9YL28_9GAMM|nr:ankyrin repeat domain-containing protein [Candidatus Berkiella aquae]MCS5712202.1 ankyrin repeat domain-containing protein [Candidatus Berkiella aquae]
MPRTSHFATSELDMLRVVLNKRHIDISQQANRQEAIVCVESALTDVKLVNFNAEAIVEQLKLETPSSRPFIFNTSEQHASSIHLSLHQAARVGDLALVKKLMAEGSNVNQQDLFGSTPLHMAVMYGHKAVVEYLCDHGADINAKTYRMDEYAYTPLDLAAGYSPNTQVFSYLLNKGAQPDHWDNLVFIMLSNAVESHEKGDFKTFDLALSKIELAAFKNKNALWVYTEDEVKPTAVFYYDFAISINDKQYYDRIMQTVKHLYAVDKSAVMNHYASAKNLLHAFPSEEVYTYLIGPNKVKITASGYFSFLAVDLAVQTLGAFSKSQSTIVDDDGYQNILLSYEVDDAPFLQNAQRFTQEKWQIIQQTENHFKQAAIVAQQVGLFEVSVDLFNRYENGETILLTTGWDGHAIDIILDKELNLFMVANSGERFSKLESGLNAYDMHFALTVDDIYLILNNRDQIDLEFKEFYDLGLERNDAYSFNMPEQLYGNCAWYSQEIAQKALMFIEMAKSTGNLDLAFDVAEQWFDEYRNFHQTYVLKTYLEDPFLEVAALGDILVDYHMTLSTPQERERAELILDVLTDDAHQGDFAKYCEMHSNELTPQFIEFIADKGYEIPGFNPPLEVLREEDVLVWDTEMIVAHSPMMPVVMYVASPNPLPEEMPLAIL